jgi:uncharacterized Zn-finger protein
MPRSGGEPLQMRTMARDMIIDPPETEIVSVWRVACDGGEGALGHPRVWLSIPEDRGWVECGYCDKRFIHEDFAGTVPPTSA